MSNAGRKPAPEPADSDGEAGPDEAGQADETSGADPTEIETGPDGPQRVDPMAPGRSLFDDDDEAVEPNEPA
jgi:hypothetical protein